MKNMSGNYNVISYAISHIGKVRDSHEDNFLLDNGEIIDRSMQKNIKLQNGINSKQYVEALCYKDRTDTAIYAVCDGMGGHNSGEIASFIAVNSLVKNRERIFCGFDIQDAIKNFQKYIETTNKNILMFCNEYPESYGMGSTLVSLLIKDNRAAIINLGDSSAFIYEKGTFSKVTKDHTEGQRLLELNIISPAELKKNKARNILTRYLGMNEEHGMPIGEVSNIFDISDEPTFLLCSDGLTDNVSENKIGQVISKIGKQNIEDIGKELLNNALCGHEGEDKGSDNITIMLIKIEKTKSTIFKKLFLKLFL
ncbi:PP2C family protein-serine/threonine phosphatase [Clostridium folliculivorans]|uniref:PP2C family protein-serine/threonine phosphatase n=1 Tax=Clostridium folliculivorans TaxID=2886038 RepID=UPI0021C3DAB4|nr:protein phosphatase 2C domain-containing protein [Clostridium folliculivorans]GKU29327.1 serine/threonine protein phosphatase [Clostridium folliculivorans]